MKKFPIYIYITLAILVASCTEKIELDLDTSSVKLVVEGNLTDQPGAHLIRIGQTAPYYAEGRLPAVTGARVTLTDGDTIITLSEQQPGDYFTPDLFAGIPGHTYTLQIELDEAIDGRTRYTAVAPMPLKTVTDSTAVKYEPDMFRGGWQIRWFAQDPPGYNAYLFRAWQNGVLVTDSLTRWTAFDDEFFNGNYTMGIGVLFFFKQRDQVINPGDTITLEVCDVTDDYQWFIQNLKNEVQPRNPLFAPPPANVPGNISDGAIGYFAAYPVQMVTTIYR